MKKRRLFFIIFSLLLIIIPFFINVYNIFRLLIVILGIILLDLSLVIDKKKHIFLLLYLPIVLLVLVYSVDYIHTYMWNLKSIFVLENKINNKVSVYNSLFYRVYKCDKEYIFDNNYEKSFACSEELLDQIDINIFLNEPIESYKKYKNDFVKIYGKISKIVGKSTIELQDYIVTDNSINGYVDFKDTSKLTINVYDEDISLYRIYDYIEVIGRVDSINKDNNEIILEDTKIVDNNLYDNYTLEVILKDKCDNNLTKYSDDTYTKCIQNIYLDYGVNKYELSYVLKTGKVKLDNILSNAKVEEDKGIKIYILDKFKIMECNNKKILLNKDEREDYSWCEE